MSKVTASSGAYDATVSKVTASSGAYDATVSKVTASSGAYDATQTKMTTSSAAYDATQTRVTTSSAAWAAAHTKITASSAAYDNVQSIFTTNSGTYATREFVHTGFFPLTGNATVTGPARFNADVTVLGSLSVAGSAAFVNTVFSTSSALSVVATVNTGPALYVGADGSGDIASFYDTNGNVEVLHVGGNDGTFPNVGVKTSTPNVDFTVSGDISARSIIYDRAGDSVEWNTAYTVANASSASWIAATTKITASSGAYDATQTKMTTSSAAYDATQTRVTTSSAAWAAAHTKMTTSSAAYDNTQSVFSTNSALYILSGGNTVNSILTIGTRSDQPLEFETNNVSAMTILSTGNIVMATGGVAAPLLSASTSKLAVSGDVTIYGSISTLSGIGVGMGTVNNVGIAVSAQGLQYPARVRVQGKANQWLDLQSWPNDVNYVLANGQDLRVGTQSNNPVIIYHTSQATVRFDNNHVGIGPGGGVPPPMQFNVNRLSVLGSMSATGTIHAAESLMIGFTGAPPTTPERLTVNGNISALSGFLGTNIALNTPANSTYVIDISATDRNTQGAARMRMRSGTKSISLETLTTDVNYLGSTGGSLRIGPYDASSGELWCNSARTATWDTAGLRVGPGVAALFTPAQAAGPFIHTVAGGMSAAGNIYAGNAMVIGLTSIPTEKLTVNGNISSNGTVVAPTLSASGNVLGPNLVYNTTDQTIGGTKTFTGDIIGNGTANRLPNQVFNTSDATLTRKYIDVDGDNYTSNRLISTDDIIPYGTLEIFNDFTDWSSRTLLTTITGGNAGTLTIGEVRDSAWVADDFISSYGVAAFNGGNHNNSAVLFTPTVSLYQTRSNFYTSRADYRVIFASMDSFTYYHFGCQPLLGGLYGNDTIAGSRGLRVDTAVSPNFFYAALSAGSARTYGLTADTGIPVLSNTWVNINQSFNLANPSTGLSQRLTSIDLSVYYTASGERRSFNFIVPDSNPNGTISDRLWLKRYNQGIIIGSQDPAAVRKTLYIDWWSSTIQPLSTTTPIPLDWNSKRFLK